LEIRVHLPDLLKHLIRTNETSVNELATIAELSDDTIYRFMSGETDPRWLTLRGWTMRLTSKKARLALANTLLTDTGIVAIESDGDLDIDHDGQVTMFDAMSATGIAMAHLAPEVERMTGALRQQHIPAAYSAAFTQHGSAAITAITKSIQIVQKKAGEQGTRRPARR
jgi:hypothetical protein